MDKIGTGVVGLGGNGQRHAHLYDAMDETELIAVCDVIPEVAEEVAARHGVKAFTRVEDMVADDAIQAVNVVTSASHCDPAVAAAEAGKHVLVEVPFAVTLDECDRMIAAADKTGVNLMYAQTHRFSPENIKLKSLIDDGAIGDVIWITWTRLGAGPPGSERWSRRTETGGGFLTYEGPHIIDQLRWLAGSDLDAAVTIGMGRFVSGGDGEDNIIGGFRLKNGGFASIIEGSSNPGPRYSDWRIVGTEGMIEVAGDGIRLGGKEWSPVTVPDHYDPPPPDIDRLRDVRGFPGFHIEFQEFLSSIREGRRPSCTGEDGKAALEGGLALRRSGETGQTVPLPLAR